MKELSIEQKAKAYDEALKVLHKYDGANIMFSQSLKEEMFPELAESEDEKIRKEIIIHFKAEQIRIKDQNRYVSWIAWLEKQGKKKSYSSETMNEKGDFDSGFTRMIEKEQKPNPVLDIEIPFGAKDSELQEASYYIPEGFYAEIEGNRIVIKRGKQTFTDTDNKFIRMRETKPKDISEFLDRLTTVEQEFLWEHIAKIRELDKEEQKSWSEEDEKNINFLYELLTDLQVKSTENEIKHGTNNRSEYYYNIKKWLKSLKPHSQWKPTDEQISLLEELVEDNNQRHFYNILRTLYEQLKKLREE